MPVRRAKSCAKKLRSKSTNLNVNFILENILNIYFENEPSQDYYCCQILVYQDFLIFLTYFKRFYPGCWKLSCALLSKHDSEYCEQNKYSKQQVKLSLC